MGYTLGTVGIGVSLLILAMIRRDQLHVRFGTSWLLVAVGFALLGFAPGVVDWLAARLGVAYPPTLAIMLAVIVLTVKLLFMDIERSRLQMQNQRLVQRLGMLEARLDERPAPGTGADDELKDEETA
jgi:hypothetical protein